MSREPDRDTTDIVTDVIDTLRAEGHDGLADDFAHMVRDELHFHNKVLSYLKIGFSYLIVIGGGLVTVGGFGYMIVENNDPLGALYVLALGVVLLGVTLLFHAMFEAFKEHLEENFIKDTGTTQQAVERRRSPLAGSGTRDDDG